ncbi:DUF2750 domain-containing protein [Alginatibacterium sediminis]|uniref:DUF2750 domain-containing protein n=1 Tax=Alginatibacterium sediminis TaxID=2164068 RepID=A0A420EGJ4_9ALTE|nr:DUF2750 domain-containing protein [Alginatibacterium sediminis]RKF19797.1 DUF2750 domain-containing protein [Alginatibacterium sediminis]
MTNKNDVIAQSDPQSRYLFFMQSAVDHQEIWILNDSDGCVMFNTDDEDCVPVWPSQEHAQAWAVDEWQDCEAKSIELKVWLERWTRGLEGDELAVVVFPNIEQEGYVMDPEELDAALRKKMNKQQSR